MKTKLRKLLGKYFGTSGSAYGATLKELQATSDNKVYEGQISARYGYPLKDGTMTMDEQDIPYLLLSSALEYFINKDATLPLHIWYGKPQFDDGKVILPIFYKSKETS